jgi:hypothetical protein
MKIWIEEITKIRYTAILVPIIGVGLQIVSWLILFPIGIAMHKDPIGVPVLNVVSAIWFFIPSFSLFGIYAGVKFLKKNGTDLFAFIGIALNTVWFLIFLLISYLVFYVGITA